MTRKKTKVEPERIRKAFFGGELSKFFAEILAEGKVSDDDIKAIGVELEALRSEEQDFASKLRKAYDGPMPGAENKPPSVQELRGGMDDKEWRERADAAIGYVNDAMAKVREGIAQKKPFHGSFWLDQATVVLSYMDLLDRDRVYRDQQYRGRMTDIIDEYGISRKEAEERAKLTPEYASYKYATLLHERVLEFVMLCKKKDADLNHR